MKRMRTLIMCILLLGFVNGSYSQFYDVKRKKRVTTVGTYSEPDPPRAAPTPQSTGTPPPRPGNEDTPTPKDSTAAPLFSPPLDTLVVTSHYGWREDPFTGKRKFHQGTDYRTCSQNVYAMMHGRIVRIGYDRRLGNYVTMDHGNMQVTYAHLHTVVGEKGDVVYPGQSVGISGSTGRSTGEHLHVSIRYGKETVDPHPVIKAITRMVRLREEKGEAGASP